MQVLFFGGTLDRVWREMNEPLPEFCTNIVYSYAHGGTVLIGGKPVGTFNNLNLVEHYGLYWLVRTACSKVHDSGAPTPVYVIEGGDFPEGELDGLIVLPKKEVPL